MAIFRLTLAWAGGLTAAILPVNAHFFDGFERGDEPQIENTFSDPRNWADDGMPISYEPLSPEAAQRVNDLAPFSLEPVETALPVIMPQDPRTFAGQASAVDCLTAAIYYEAGSEPTAGQQAVAQVILNRVRHPAFPNSVCKVVMQGSERRTGCQFTFTCDGSLLRRPTRQGWSKARQVALAALSGWVDPSVGMATHYHADYVRPYWASSLNKIAAVGAHVFYRWTGSWGLRRSFNQTLDLGPDTGMRQALAWANLPQEFDRDEAALSATLDPAHPALPTTGPFVSSAFIDIDQPILPLTFGELREDRRRGALIVDETAGTLLTN